MENRKLGHQVRPSNHSEHALPRRSFFQKVGSAAVLLAALGVAGPTATISNEAKADVNNSVLGNHRLTVVRLDKTLQQLDRDTDKYRNNGFSGELTLPDGAYTNELRIPGEVSFVVFLKPTVDNEKGFIVTFPQEKEKQQTVNPGLRGGDLDKFAKLVKEVSGKELERVKIIVKTGTFDHEGKETKYAEAYFLPIDKQGNYTTGLGNGQFLAVTCIYYADQVTARQTRLVEPSQQGIRVAER